MSESDKNPNLNNNSNGIDFSIDDWSDLEEIEQTKEFTSAVEKTSDADDKAKKEKRLFFSKKEKSEKNMADAKNHGGSDNAPADPTNMKAYKRYQSKKRFRKVMNTLMGIAIFFGLLGSLCGVSVIKMVLDKTDVVLETDDLVSKDSSLIFDDAGNQIAIIGSESRISYSYKDMPQVLIDAFVSVEDSRFFEHSGFDVPRFAKAFLECLKTMSFSQGGSTITMQVIKNTYFAVDTIAEKSLGRKIQEIYFSIKITQAVPRSKIIEMYINKVNYGANARGVQVASQYYFNKNCNELTLVEAAMLAGIVNAPNANNPYVYLDNCKERTREVLYLMYYHGYITHEEFEVATKVKIENLLKRSKNYSSGGGNYINNQAYIDVVLSELESKYEIDPYYTPVRIYTGMNQTVQATCDAIAKGQVISYYDDNLNYASTVIQNYTGLVVGICGGRNYNGARLYNYAYDNRTSPGSTSKIVFTYPLCFEYCGISSSHTFYDEPVYYEGTPIRLSNDSNSYNGQVTLQRCIPSSYNTTSLLAYRMVVDEVGTKVMREYLRNIGFDESVVQMMNEQFCIGCYGFEVSTTQMAAAQSMLLSGGIYSEPHTITRIEFINSDREPITATVKQTRALSAEAAWLTTYEQNLGVNGGGNASDRSYNGRLTGISHRGFTCYGKTGSNGYDSTVCDAWGYPNSATKDLYYIAGTNDYSLAFWQGYDTGRYQDKTTWMSTSYCHSSPDVPVINALIDATVSAYGVPAHKNEKPAGIETITFIDGYFPYTVNPSYSKNPTIWGYVKSDKATLQTWADPSIATLQDFDVTYDSATQTLTATYDSYPFIDYLLHTGTTYPIKYMKGEVETTDMGAVRFAEDWVNGVVQYCYEIYLVDGSGKQTFIYAGASDDPYAAEDAANGLDEPSHSTVSLNINLSAIADLPEDMTGVKIVVDGFYAYSQADVMCSRISTNPITLSGVKIDPPEPEDYIGWTIQELMDEGFTFVSQSITETMCSFVFTNGTETVNVETDYTATAEDLVSFNLDDHLDIVITNSTIS